MEVCGSQAWQESIVPNPVPQHVDLPVMMATPEMELAVRKQDPQEDDEEKDQTTVQTETSPQVATIEPVENHP